MMISDSKRVKARFMEHANKLSVQSEAEGSIPTLDRIIDRLALLDSMLNDSNIHITIDTLGSIFNKLMSKDVDFKLDPLQLLRCFDERFANENLDLVSIFYYISLKVSLKCYDQLDDIIESTGKHTNFFNSIIQTKFTDKVSRLFLNASNNTKSDSSKLMLVFQAILYMTGKHNESIVKLGINLLDKSNGDNLRLKRQIDWISEDVTHSDIRLLKSHYNRSLRSECLSTDLGSLQIHELNMKIDYIKLNDYEYQKKVYELIKNSPLPAKNSWAVLLDVLKGLKVVFNSTGTDKLGPLHLVDFITLKISQIKITNDSDCVSDSLNLLFNIVNCLHQIKRIRNISILYYRFGTQISSPETSVSFYERSIDAQEAVCELSNAPKDIAQLTKRCERIASDLINKNEYDKSIQFISKIFEYQIRSNEDLLEIENKLQGPLLTASKLSCKNVISSGNVSLLFKISESESVTTCLIYQVCLILGELQNANAAEKLITQFIIQCKSRLHDIGLFLYFLSKISFTIKFQIAFKGIVNIDIDPLSPAYTFRDVIKAHIFTLQACTSSGKSESLILHAYNCLLNRLKSMKSPVSNYESSVAATNAEALERYGLVQHSIKILKMYLPHLPKQSLILGKMTLQLSRCYKIIGQSIPPVSNEFEDDPLSHLRYEILTSLDYAGIRRKFTTDPHYALSKQTNRNRMCQLIFAYSEFSTSFGLNSLSNARAIDAIFSFKRALRLLQSIMKNFFAPATEIFDLNSKMLVSMEFASKMIDAYENLLDAFFYVGLGKEVNYFMNELVKFANAQHSPYLRCKALLATSRYESLRGKYESSKGFLAEAFQIPTIVHGILDTEKVISKEYYQILSSNDVNVSNDDKYLEAINWENSLGQQLAFLRTSFGLNLPINDHSFNVLEESSELEAHINDHLDLNYDTPICYPLGSSTVIHKSNSILNALKLSFKNLSKFLKENDAPVYQYRRILFRLSSFLFDLLPFSTVSFMDSLMNQLYLLENHFLSAPFNLEQELAEDKESSQELLPPLELSSKLSFSNALFTTDDLPKDWVIVEIVSDSRNNLIILNRFDKFHKTGLTVKINLKSPSISIKDTIYYFQSIISRSDKTTSFNTVRDIKSKEDRANWWHIRRDLDDELKTLLQGIQAKWLGGFSAMLGTHMISENMIISFKKHFIDILINHLNNLTMKADVQKMKTDLNLLDPRAFELLLQLPINASMDDLEDLIYLILNVLNNKQDYSELDIESICHELSELISHISIEKEFDHMILIPVGKCLALPWESIPVLRNVSVSRMPSLGLLQQYLKEYQPLLKTGIDPDKGYYVLNPSGDLKRTENRLKDKFTVMSGWTGVIHKKPAEKCILDAFKTRSLCFYAGHGGGEQYIRSKSIQSAHHIPPILLMGCSSGLVHTDGVLHPYGTVYNYLSAHCPMILVNLWDVTDKDIDKFTIASLKKWGLFVDYDTVDIDLEPANVTSLPRCVSDSRDCCKLPFLNGAAPVIYGLPLKLQTKD